MTTRMAQSAQQQPAAPAAPETVNFRTLLSKPTDEAERPKSLPTGHYIGTILSHEFGKTRGKQTDFVRFNIRIEEPCDDVSVDDCKGIDFSRRELRKDYFITPNAVYRLSDALDAILGKETGRSFDDRIPNMNGQRVQVGVTPRLMEDGTDSGYNEVTTLVAA